MSVPARTDVRHPVLWAVLCSALLVAGYAAAPLRRGSLPLVVVLVVVLAGVVAVPFLFLRRRALVTSDRPLVDAAVTVALMLVTLVVGFLSIYATMARTGRHLPGLDTKVDAVYFTVTTLATVGFGDIHAASEPARVVVTIQMLFDLTVVAVAARLLFGVAQARRTTRAAS